MARGSTSATPGRGSTVAPRNNDPLSRLPPYEEPYVPLHGASLSSFKDMGRPFDDNHRGGLVDNIKQALEYLKDASQDIADTKTADLDDSITQIEEAARAMVDLDQSRKDIRAALTEIETKYAADAIVAPRIFGAQPAGEDGDDDEEEDQRLNLKTGKGPSQLVDEKVDARAQEYDGKAMRNKYGDNREYLNLYTAIFRTMNPGKDAPPVRQWFDEANKTVLHPTGRGRPGETSDDEEDEDLEFREVRAVVSYKCPITQLTFKEPVRIRECGHCFEKLALINYVNVTGRGRKPVPCPQAGCRVQNFTMSDFELDEFLMREIRRQQEARGTQSTQTVPDGADHVDLEDEEMDEDLVPGSARKAHSQRVKGERQPRRQEEEEDSDVEME